MAVNLTNAEIRQFELAGITKDMIGKTIERDRAAGIPDQDIQLNAVMKADQLEKANPSFDGSIVRGGLRTISNLPFGDTINRGLMSVKALDEAYTSVPTDKIKAAYNATLDYLSGNNKPTLRQYLEAPEGTTPPDRSWKDLYKDNYNKIRESKGETFSENYTKNMNKLERTYKEQNYDIPKWYRWLADAGVTIGSYGLLPEGIYETVPRAMAFSAADAYQSGINKDVKDRAVNSIVSALTAGALTKVANKISGKDALNKATKEYPLLTEGFKKNPPQTEEEALERIIANYAKRTSKRADQELEKFVSNLSDTQVERLLNPKSGGSFVEAHKKIWEKIAGPSEKTIKEVAEKTGAPEELVKNLSRKASADYINNLQKSGITVNDLAEIPGRIGQLKNVASNAPKTVDTSGLGGGIIGGLTGNALFGPVGAIVGALGGSRGKIIPMVGDVASNISKRSANKIASALINPKTLSPATKLATKLAPRVLSAPAMQQDIKEAKKYFIDGIDKDIKPSKKNTVKNSDIPFSYLPNNIIALPESNDSGESITQKRLQLIAALDPNFFSGTKVA